MTVAQVLLVWKGILPGAYFGQSEGARAITRALLEDYLEHREEVE